MKKYSLLIILIALCISTQAQDIEKIINADPFKVSGSLSGRASFSAIDGIEERTNPYFYALNARLKFSFYGFDLPLYFSYRNSSYNFGSNFPRIKLRPKYKWFEMQIGDVYTRLNPYVLDNRNLRGAAIKLTPGKIRFQAIYGKMQELNAFRDTLLIGTNDDLSFSRPVAGLALGYGSNRNYIELYALRAWDDQEEDFYTEKLTTAKSNLIIGASTKNRLFRKLNISTNFGISALTNNLNAVGSTEALYENELTGSLLDLNITTNVNYAGDISLGYRYRNLGLTAQVRYIQAHYQPLTVAYINTDLIDYTVGSSLGLFSNKVLLNGRVGFQKNNISQTDEITNKRVIYSLLTKWRMTPSLSINAVINNYSTNLEAKTININDLYTYSVNNNSRNLSLIYRQPGDGNSLLFKIKAGTSNFTTISENEENATYNSLISDASMGYRWSDIDLETSVGVGYNRYNRSEIITKSYTTHGNISKLFFEKKLRLAYSTRYSLIDLIEYREGTNWLNQVGTSYQLGDQSSLSLQLMHLRRSSYINPTFTEWRSSISYRQSFK